MAELSPTARRLVAAARRLLARGGFEALTVEAVAAEAGAYRDAVRYYFGSKAAFIATVVDALAHEQSLEGALKTRDLPAGAERVRALVDADRRLAEDLGSFRDFFTILPHALRDDELRERVARLYDWYRALYVRALDGDDAERAADAAGARPPHGGHDRRPRRAEAPRPRAASTSRRCTGSGRACSSARWPSAGEEAGEAS